jgi:hypothetical protein
MNHSNLRFRKRAGISPVIATTIILAITITLGLALWSFANSGVGAATSQYSEAVTDYGEVVRTHRFVIANMDFNNPDDGKVSFWVYNNGKVDLTLSNDFVILVCSRDCTSFDSSPSVLTQVSPDDATRSLTVLPNSLKKFYFTAGDTLQPGGFYELTIIGKVLCEDGEELCTSGLTETYSKKMAVVT